LLAASMRVFSTTPRLPKLTLQTHQLTLNL
jgi:hypothetical protein